MTISKDYIEYMNYALSVFDKKSIFFGDIRYTNHLEMRVIARDEKVSELKRSSEKGIGIRVQAKKGGPLTFVSTSNLSKASIEDVIEEARKTCLTLAKLSSKDEVHLAEQPIVTKEYVHDSNDSLFVSDLENVKDFVMSHVNEIKQKDVSSASCGIAGVVHYKHIMTSEGTDVAFLVDGVGYKGDATIRKMGKFETYSERKGGTFGFKNLTSLLESNKIAEEVGQTVGMMVKGKPVDSGKYDIVIDPAFSGLLAHESFGHMTEADSITTHESALADRLGERFAPEFVSIVDDPTYDTGAWNLVDDEAVVGKRNVLLNQGILERFMSDRKNAYLLETNSTGNSRATDYGHPPIVRMTNTCFVPQDHSFDEIIEDVQHGLFLKGHAGGEAGNTGKFSFRSQVGFLIDNGEITDTVSSVTLNGNILQYLGKIDAVGKDFELTVDCGFGGCGKGGQTALVGLGGTYLRFRDVDVTGSVQKKMPSMGMMK